MDHRPDLIIGDVFEAVGDVFTDGSREKDSCSGEQRPICFRYSFISRFTILIRSMRILPSVGGRKPIRRFRIVDFPVPDSPAKADALAGFDLQVKILQNISFPIGIFEIHVAETDVSLEVAQRDDGMVGLHLLFFENIADGTDGLHSLAEIRVNIDESGDLSDDLGEIGLEQNHLADADLPLTARQPVKARQRIWKLWKTTQLAAPKRLFIRSS